MKRIGLVLANSPGYSETFFRNKIEVLNEAGFEVILFADRISSKVPGCKQVGRYALPSSSLFRMVKIGAVFVRLLITAPKKTWKFISLEQKEKRSFSAISRNLYRSAHILSYSLDWLHFGFVTLAIGREHVAQVIGAKMGVSFRGYDISIYPLKYPNCYSLVWKKVDKVHSISTDLYQIALSLGLSEDIPMMRIPPAINIERFSSNKRPPVPNQKEPLRIITVARLHWKKGLDVALEALMMLREKGIKFKYTIVGDGEEFERLLHTRHVLGLDTEVVFADKKSQEELVELLLDTHIYLQPSTQEGFCNATLEAQACGLLCIVSNAEGLPENVEDTVTGWVVPRLAPNSLAEKIMDVINLSSEVKHQVQKNAIERVRNKFGLQSHASSFPLFYQ